MSDNQKVKYFESAPPSRPWDGVLTNSMSQSFTISINTTVSSVALYLSKANTTDTTSGQSSFNDNDLIVDIFIADENNLPTGDPLNSTINSIKAKDVEYAGFKTIKFIAPLFLQSSVSTKYCVVVRENIVYGGFPVFQWYASNSIYSGVSAKYTSQWQVIADRNFYFRVYYDGSSVPVSTVNNVNFEDGNQRGTRISVTGLTTRMKMAVVLIIDDSKSMDTLSEDILIQKKLKIKNIIDRIYTQTSSSTLVDIWVYGREVKDITGRFISDKWSVLEYIDLLYNKGTRSYMYEASVNAIGGLNYQSIVDALDYPNINDEPSESDLLLAKEYVPVIILVSDGHASGSGSPEDVAIAANSAWDDDGVPIIIYGWGNNKSQSVLRTIVDQTSGLFFDINDLHSCTRCEFGGDLIITDEPHGLTNSDKIVFVYSTYGISSMLEYWVVYFDSVSFYISETYQGSNIILGITSVSDIDYNYYCKTDDWALASASTDHLQVNNIYKGSWSQQFDFINSQWVKDVGAFYTVNSNGKCSVSVRYTKDRFTWSNWISIISNSPYVINDLVYALDFKIEIEDGWDSYTVPNTVETLYYTTVEPSLQYLITDPIRNNGMIYQYLLSASADLPPTARVTWAICRGDSTNFVDFEYLYNGRKSVLPNRQLSIRYTQETIQENLISKTVPGFVNTYSVEDSNGTTITWGDTDVIVLKISGGIIDRNQVNYSTDASKGWIIMPIDYVLPTGVSFVVDIITPEDLTNVIGELAYTYDNRTYYATNGIWSPDASVIVLKNGNIIRGGYWTAPEFGTVTFSREQETDDIVSVYIQHSSYYRIGVEVLNYDENSTVTLNNAGLYFTELSNSSLVNQYLNSKSPTLENLSIVSNNGSIYSRMYIDYDFIGWQGAKEQGTMIRWWKTTLLNVRTEIVEYRNRITEPMIDVKIGNGKFEIDDSIQVEVIPSDGTLIAQWTGNSLDTKGLNTYLSDTITITGGTVPVVWDLRIVFVSLPSKYSNLSIDPVDGAFIMVDTENNPTAHGLKINEKIGFIASVFPYGLSPSIPYYALPDSADTSKFRVTTIINSSTAVVISGLYTDLQMFKYVIKAPAGEALNADYQFYSQDNPTDRLGNACTINWYVNDITIAPIYTGRTLPSTVKTVKGQSIFFTVLPKNETMDGIIVQSDSVQII